VKQIDLKGIKKEEVKYLGVEQSEPEINSKLEGYEGMRVKWLYPYKNTYWDWIEASAHACLTTWEMYPYESINAIGQDKKEELVLNILRDRPISVALEMPKFAFKVTGLSRAISHQLVRHRKMAFGQQSIRVVDVTGAPTRKPQNISGELLDIYGRTVVANKRVYKELVSAGVPREQARNILPIGTTTSIVAVSDLRTLIDYFKGRTSGIAQGEHNYLVYLIAKSFQESQPEFFKFVCTKVDGLEKLVSGEPKELIE